MGRIFAFACCLTALVVSLDAFAAEHSGRATYGEALRWYFNAAEAGDARAQFLLGLKYETGTDVARDLKKAADWYEKAARQGNLEAQFKYATMLEQGRGRPADKAAAAQWYGLAARAGFAPAQYNLGVLQLNTASDEAARIEGLVWLILAREQGVAAAGEFLARIEAAWPPELVAAARRRAEETPRPGN